MAASEAGDKSAVRAALRDGEYSRKDPAFVAAAWAAYSDEQTPSAIAKATGCSGHTAQALIEEGGTCSPPFRLRWARIVSLANAQIDAKHADDLASITTGLEDAGAAVADMMHLARKDVAQVRAEGGTFEKAHAKAPVGLLRDAVTTLDKAGAHLRAVKDGRQPGETPLEQVLGQAFSGLLGSVVSAAQAAQQARLEGRELPELPALDFDAPIPTASASVPQDASQVANPSAATPATPEAQEGAVLPPAPPEPRYKETRPTWRPRTTGGEPDNPDDYL